MMGMIALVRSAEGWIKRGLLLLVVAMALLQDPQALAITPTPVPPVIINTDFNGMDYKLRTFDLTSPELSIGQAVPQGMDYVRFWHDRGWRDNLAITLSGTASNPVVTRATRVVTFSKSSGVYTPKRGANLVQNGTTTYTFTDRDGAVIEFAQANGASYDRFVANLGWATYVLYPNGTRWDFHYRSQTYCPQPLSVGSCPVANATSVRLQSVTNNFGYQLKLEYGANTLADINGLDIWNQVTKVIAINNAIESCTPTADTCSLTNNWPSVAYANSTSGSVETQSVTNALGGVTRYTLINGRITGIKRPSSSVDNVTITYDATSNYITSVNKDGIVWNYGVVAGNIVVTGPASAQYTYDNGSYSIGKITDSLGRATYYEFNNVGLLTSFNPPDSDAVTYSFDVNENMLTGIIPGSAGDTITQVSAEYNSCTVTNFRFCNKPKKTKDALGRETKYGYDSNHGGLKQKISPLPYSSSRQEYVSVSSPYVGGGTIFLNNIYGSCEESIGEYTCRDQSIESKISTSFGSESENYQPLSVTKEAGDGSGLQSTIAMTYDMVGNPLTVDGPLSGAADTTRTRYDALRRAIGVVGPDPDGAGPLKHRATRTTYDEDGNATLVEQGVVDSQSDGDWSAMTVLQAVRTTFDSAGRKIKVEFLTGAAARLVTQYSYDAVGRLECTALRMNPAVFGSLPTSACSLGVEGAQGPDRITRTVYNAAGDVLKVQKAYGTTLQQDEVTYSYNVDGQVSSILDSNGNRTSYNYYSSGRIWRIDYPSRTVVGSSNSADREEFTYIGGKVETKKLRNNKIITYDYPSSGISHYVYHEYNGISEKNTLFFNGIFKVKTQRWEKREYDPGATGWKDSIGSDYIYDVFGNNTQRTDRHALGGQVLTWIFQMEYDVAGRRSRLIWPDGFYVTYEYDVLGQLTTIKENGATPLVSFAYDDLGRRTSVTRGNGTTTTYSYDTSSRLSQVADDLGGAGGDQTLGFSYNSANQITEAVRSNDAYAWTQNYNVNRNYMANGLNQYTAAGAIAPTYDAMGNLTSAGSTIYKYDWLNQLREAGASSLFYYGNGNLGASKGSDQRFAYDGSKLIAEYNSTGTILRRYVHEFGDDNPLVWYEGSGVTDKRWLSTDERGSVTAIADASGAVININSYDSWGIPQST
ncbi:RHS repeat domain-containing protein, partial [Rhizorhabdus wittichii]|uniref:RHS repeat domain-containing protein n=1 Tax=Rhizorhabdus wittichii TaxID=160791 RepID=UPI0012FDEC34